MASGTHDTTEQVLNEMRALRDELGALVEDFDLRAAKSAERGEELRAMVERHSGYAVSEAYYKAARAVLRAESYQGCTLTLADVQAMTPAEMFGEVR